jgi:C-terminal processing protease CtpA/Prc
VSKPVPSCNDISRTPLILLTSKNTASAAELLALMVRNRDRGVVIGQNTYGAGRPVELFELAHGFSAYIPISTIVDDVNNEGFELSGVEPDILLK